MKYFATLILIFYSIAIFAQTQIGNDIDGETIGDLSGHSVSLSSNGTRLAIGAIGADQNGSECGQIRIYEESGGIWTQVGGDIDGQAAADNLGYSVALSADGKRVACGGYLASGNGFFSGVVRIFDESGGVWTQVGSNIDGEAAGDYSGWSVSLSSDGTRLAIGAWLNGGNGSQSGHVRIFDESGGAWTQVGSDIDGEAVDDFSGNAVSLSSDGNRVAIGARLNDGGGENAGHVRIYKLVGSTWTQVGSDINGASAGDQFGNSVSLSAAGTRLAVGAWLKNGSTGQVRIFDESGGVWTQVGSEIDGEGANDYCGQAVSLSANGVLLAIGANENDGNGSNSGHVRLFEESGGTWMQVGSDIDGEAVDDNSGWSVSLSPDGNRLAIGARLNDGIGNFAGHVRIFGGLIFPVELIRFEGRKIDTHISLLWQTASEENNEVFEVQKSRTGKDWRTIGSVKGKGTTSEFNEYHFQDRNPYTGINYYRLKQVDYSGEFEYSKIISVGVDAQPDILIYPNPTAGIIHVTGIDNGSYRIVNGLGTRLKTAALNSQPIDISDLPNGIYFIQILHQGRIITKNVVKN